MGNSELVLVYESQGLSQSQLIVCHTQYNAVCSYAVFDAVLDAVLEEATGETTSVYSGFITFTMSDEVTCSWSDESQ